MFYPRFQSSANYMHGLQAHRVLLQKAHGSIVLSGLNTSDKISPRRFTQAFSIDRKSFSSSTPKSASRCCKALSWEGAGIVGVELAFPVPSIIAFRSRTSHVYVLLGLARAVLWHPHLTPLDVDPICVLENAQEMPY